MEGRAENAVESLEVALDGVKSGGGTNAAAASRGFTEPLIRVNDLMELR